MDVRKFATSVLASLSLLGSLSYMQAATAVWTGAGDGASWSDSANWSGGSVPVASDDVVISGIGSDRRITITNDVTVRSLQSSASLVVAGGLAVFEGTSLIEGDLRVAAGRWLSVTGPAHFDARGNANLDGANLNASGGARMTIAALTSTTRGDWNGVTWQAAGVGSVLELPGLTNIGASCPVTFWIQALGGGHVQLTNLIAIADCDLQVLSEGSGSVVDLSGVRNGLTGMMGLEARSAGTIRVPQITEGERVNLTLRQDGVIDTSQLVRIKNVTVDGATLTLPQVTNINGASLWASSGGKLILPGVQSYTRGDWNGVTWQAAGVGSVLDLPGLTNIGASCPVTLWIQALGGGHVQLTNLIAVADCDVLVVSEGAGSLVDLSGVRNGLTGMMGLEARSAGTIRVPQITEGERLNLTLRQDGVIDTSQLVRIRNVTVDGATLTLPQVTNINGASLWASSGGKLILPGVQSYTRGDWNGVTWQAAGVGSVLDLPGLTNIGASCPVTFWIQALGGGHVQLTNLIAVADCDVLVVSEGAGSVVDLSGVRNGLTGMMGLEARSAGTIRVPQITEGERVNLTLRQDGVVDTSQLVRIKNVTVDGATLTLPLVTNINGASLWVASGGKLILPGVESYTRGDWNGVTWQAAGVGSVLDLPGLTNIGASCPVTFWIQALGGGHVQLTNLIAVADCDVQVVSEGAGSVVDLGGVRNGLTGMMGLEARSAGTIRVPQITEGERVNLTLRQDGVVDTSQLVRIKNVTVDGATLTLPLVTNINGASLWVASGGKLILPGVESYTRGDWNGVTWQAAGVGSVLELPGLTNIGASCPVTFWIQALGGGQVQLTNLIAVADCDVQVVSEGAGSLVDLSGLRNGLTGTMGLEARTAGTIRVPQITEGERVNLTLRQDGVVDTSQLVRIKNVTVDGATLTLPLVTNINGASLWASSGGKLILPGVQSYTRGDWNGVIWQAAGVGSTLDLPGLTNIGASCPVTFWIQALGGGQVSLPNLAAVADCDLRVLAEGGGSLVSLAAVDALVPAAGARIELLARGEGRVDLSSVESIAGGSVVLVADGEGSLIALPKLTAFATPLGVSELTATNAGKVLLPGKALLLANVAVNVALGPDVPPTFSAGASVSLYAAPWVSYQVDVRDSRDPASPWGLWKRVAQTNQLQVIGSAPLSWQVFRVAEFQPSAPVIDSSLTGAGLLQLTIFAPVGLDNTLEQTEELAPGLVPWSSTGYSTGLMTNTFRILDPIVPPLTNVFYRVRQP